MFRRMVQAIIDSSFLDDTSAEEIPLVSQGSAGVPLTRENFHPLTIFKKELPEMAFCDGGNCEILSAPNASIQLIRGYFSIFRSNQKVFSHTEQFYLLVKAQGSDGKINYKCRFFSEMGSELSEEEICALFNIPQEEREEFFSSTNNFTFDPFDRNLTTSRERATPSKIAEVIRRLFELAIAERAAHKLECGILILDGSLQESHPSENYLMQRLFSKCKFKRIVLGGMSKTSNLLTNSGKPLLPLLSSISPFSEWYYFPIVKEQDDSLVRQYVVKLNSSSPYSFRIEIASSPINAEEVFWALQKNATDYAFPGYPYGLIDADKFAQVSNDEKKILVAALLSESGSSKLQLLGASLDAHKILNTL
ncbi:MAG: hypothetical protein QXS55_02125 [Candidatus Woesearchaeota archaeon]